MEGITLGCCQTYREYQCIGIPRSARDFRKQEGIMKVLLLLLVLCGSVARAQKAPEGIWEGFDGEWKHVSSQLIALAEATPAEKFAWRPAVDVRSTSEVYM